MAPKLLHSSDDPFPHFVLSDFYDLELADKLNCWLSSEAIWHHAVHNFYDQFELNFKHVISLPECIASALLTPAALGKVKKLAEDLFGMPFRPNLCIGAHKLVDGQGIGIHTDSSPGEESHRIVVQLSRGWQDNFGGHLVFFGSADVNDVRHIFRHVYNTAIGFPLGSLSYHAVTNLSQGNRFTMIYGFWSVSSKFDVSRNATRTFAFNPLL